MVEISVCSRSVISGMLWCGGRKKIKLSPRSKTLWSGETEKLGQSPLSAARKLRSKSILADFRDEQGGGGKSGGLPTGSLRVRRYF
jgi:hypothetical protein